MEKHLENLGVSAYGNQQSHHQQESQSRRIAASLETLSVSAVKTQEAIQASESISETRLSVLESKGLSLSEIRAELERQLEQIGSLDSESNILESRLLVLRREGSKLSADLIRTDVLRDKTDYTIIGLEDEISRVEKDIDRYETKLFDNDNASLKTMLRESLEECLSEESERRKIELSLKSNIFFLKKRNEFFSETLQIVQKDISNESNILLEIKELEKQILIEEKKSDKLMEIFIVSISKKDSFLNLIKASREKIFVENDIGDQIKKGIDGSNEILKKINEFKKVKESISVEKVNREISKIKNCIYEKAMNSHELRNIFKEKEKLEIYLKGREIEFEKFRIELNRVEKSCVEIESKNESILIQINGFEKIIFENDSLVNTLQSDVKFKERELELKRSKLEKMHRQKNLEFDKNLSEFAIGLVGKIKVCESNIIDIMNKCKSYEIEIQNYKPNIVFDEKKIEKNEMELFVFSLKIKRKTLLIDNIRRSISKINSENRRSKLELEKIMEMTRMVEKKILEKNIGEKSLENPPIFNLINSNDELEEQINGLIKSEEQCVRDKLLLEQEIEEEKISIFSEKKFSDSKNLEQRINQFKHELSTLNKRKEIASKSLITMVNKRGVLEKKRKTLSSCTTSCASLNSVWSQSELRQEILELRAKGIRSESSASMKKLKKRIGKITPWSVELSVKEKSNLENKLKNIKQALNTPGVITEALSSWIDAQLELLYYL